MSKLLRILQGRTRQWHNRLLLFTFHPLYQRPQRLKYITAMAQIFYFSTFSNQFLQNSDFLFIVQQNSVHVNEKAQKHYKILKF